MSTASAPASQGLRDVSVDDAWPGVRWRCDSSRPHTVDGVALGASAAGPLASSEGCADGVGEASEVGVPVAEGLGVPGGAVGFGASLALDVGVLVGGCGRGRG